MMFRLRTLGFLTLLACFAASAQENHEKLYSAIRAGDLTGLKALLDHGISADTPDTRQITPLMYAGVLGSADTMRILIDHGASVNARNAFGSTVLMWSAADAQKARLLLDHGADVNTVSKSGRTALMTAAGSAGSAAVVRMLLDRKAEVTPRDQMGNTALLTALGAGNTESIRMLVEAGSDIHHPELFFGETPLMVAAGTGNPDAVGLLLAKGAKVNDVSLRETPGMKVKNGIVAFGQVTPLIMAASYGPPEVVKALLDAGADVNARDVRGMTPLMLALATDRYNPAIVRLLLDHGADPAIKSVAGENARDWARKIGASGIAESLNVKQAPVTLSAAKPTPDARVALARSVQMLEKGSASFFVTGGCTACHAQVPTNFAVAAARAKGIHVDEKAAKERLQQITFGFVTAGPVLMDRQGFVGGDGSLYIFEALGRGGYAPNTGTDFLMAELVMEQAEDGHWPPNPVGTARTPLQDNPYSRTTMAIRAMKTYGTPGRAAEIKERIDRAEKWLLRAEPVTTEDFAMRLAGAFVAGAGHAELERLAEPLIARVRPDGGWGQRDELPSDAYGTGMTLSALAEAGIVGPEHSLYRRGVQFLLSTQAEDGSWHVASRAAKFQPYFESGFPYGHDQWISSMGTGWAANALAVAIEAPLQAKQ